MESAGIHHLSDIPYFIPEELKSILTQLEEHEATLLLLLNRELDDHKAGFPSGKEWKKSKTSNSNSRQEQTNRKTRQRTGNSELQSYGQMWNSWNGTMMLVIVMFASGVHLTDTLPLNSQPPGAEAGLTVLAKRHVCLPANLNNLEGRDVEWWFENESVPYTKIYDRGKIINCNDCHVSTAKDLCIADPKPHQAGNYTRVVVGFSPYNIQLKVDGLSVENENHSNITVLANGGTCLPANLNNIRVSEVEWWYEGDAGPPTKIYSREKFDSSKLHCEGCYASSGHDFCIPKPEPRHTGRFSRVIVGCRDESGCPDYVVYLKVDGELTPSFEVTSTKAITQTNASTLARFNATISNADDDGWTETNKAIIGCAVGLVGLLLLGLLVIAAIYKFRHQIPHPVVHRIKSKFSKSSEKSRPTGLNVTELQKIMPSPFPQMENPEQGGHSEDQLLKENSK